MLTTFAGNYLDWLLALPWADSTPLPLSRDFINAARTKLDEDHYGLGAFLPPLFLSFADSSAQQTRSRSDFSNGSQSSVSSKSNGTPTTPLSPLPSQPPPPSSSATPTCLPSSPPPPKTLSHLPLSPSPSSPLFQSPPSRGTRDRSSSSADRRERARRVSREVSPRRWGGNSIGFRSEA